MNEALTYKTCFSFSGLPLCSCCQPGSLLQGINERRTLPSLESTPALFGSGDRRTTSVADLRRKAKEHTESIIGSTSDEEV